MKRLCVFCGSNVGNRPVYRETAVLLGKQLVQQGLELVFGAGHVGLMGVLADAVLNAGGRAVGVIPHSLVERELAHGGLSELHVVATMHERKAKMADLSDAFLALPGGYGTGDELFEILTWAQLGLHQKPIGLLNVAGFFDPMLAWLDHMANEAFLRPRHRQLVLVDEDPVKIVQQLATYCPGENPGKWLDR